MTIDSAQDVVDALHQCLDWLEFVHTPQGDLNDAMINLQPCLPDPVESIKIIHLAASIAALESEC
jgi:hypothetical protein